MIFSRAPLRIPLGGGGSNLPSYSSRYGGFVLSAAIDKYVCIYLNRPAADTLLCVKYSRYEQASSVDEIQHHLVRPTLKLLAIEDNEIASMADIPDGNRIAEPHELYSLAAQSVVVRSSERPVGTTEVTGRGVTRVLEPVRAVNLPIRGSGPDEGVRMPEGCDRR